MRNLFRTAAKVFTLALFAMTRGELFAQAPQCAHAAGKIPNETLSPSIRAELTQARAAVWRAYFTGDSSALVRLLPEHMTAMPQERRDIIRDARRFVQDGGKFVSIDFADDRFFADGNVAIVWSRYTVHLADAAGAAQLQEGCAIELFVKAGNRWINPHWHLDMK
jgi:hypothetical protein